MKGLIGLLAKAKLVVLSEEERARIEPEDVAIVAEPVAQAPSPPPEPLPPEASEIVEGKAFAAIFADNNVPESPFPAERLLRLLDGLRAMDASTRKLAVLAMDAADDNWQIADPVIDAQRKIAALESTKQHLQAQVSSSEQHTAAQVAELKAMQERNAAAIRKQIAELEQLLERDVTSSAQQITILEGALRATREAAAREAHRMDLEIERLREIPSHFTQQPTQA